MKHLGQAQLAIVVTLLTTLALIGCTDRRQARVLRGYTPGPTYSSLVNVAEATFDGDDTMALQMVTAGNSVFLTGKSFGFARWDVGANPEDPYKTFMIKEQIDTFSPEPNFGAWIVDGLASGALGIYRNYALMSGNSGMSVVDMRNTNYPVEVERYPRPTSAGQTTQDINYIYKAIVTHPSLPFAYGFSEQDYIYTLSLSGLPRAPVIGKMPYSNSGPVCCVSGAAVFNNRVFVAMKNRLRIYSFNSDGSLTYVGDSTMLSPVNVIATSKFLYVQHQPLTGTYNSSAAGIYVFDSSGNQVNFLPVNPYAFTVSPQDTHLYANQDDLTVQIYRIVWTK